MAIPQRIPEGKIRLTYKDYCLLPNDGKRYEVLDGELAMTPAPTPKHQDVSRNLERLLDQHVVAHDLGKVYDAPIDLILSETTVLQPDLLFLSKARLHFVTERAVEGPPDLVVEILSPATARTDRITKAQLYARYEGPHYWLVDPDERSLEAYELAEGSYRLAASFTGDAPFSPSLFPGLTIELRRLWP